MTVHTEYVGFWDMAERMLSDEGLETLRQEKEWHNEAAQQAHESWAERFNEYALGGTDDRPGFCAPPTPSCVRWIEELVKANSKRVKDNTLPRPHDPDIPF